MSSGGRERKMEAALREYSAAEALFPGNVEMKFWHAVSLANAGRVEDSLPLFKEISTADRNWAILLPRLPKVDLLNAGQETIERILAATQ